jgi:DNA-binding NarL/FixJ family response regulator
LGGLYPIMKRRNVRSVESVRSTEKPPVIKIGIVEDNRSIRESLRRILELSPGFQCVCAAGSGEEALAEFVTRQPDVVLMDINLPRMSGIECTSHLRRLIPDLQVIMLTVYEDNERIFQALRAGARGYLLKRAGMEPERLLAAIREVKEGGAPMNSAIARKVVEAFQEPAEPDQDAAPLSQREKEVLQLLCGGYANKEIADQLHLSIETVRDYLKSIYDKLHVRSRTEAVLKALSASKQPPLRGTASSAPQPG